jgi:hypothetical protein|tara:strand:- start:3258 stop:3809 length:552 start_codon:yes stop_codon:yes gene_type:complete
MSKITQAVKNNKIPTLCITLAAVVLLLASSLAGCNLQDIVSVKVPEGVQAAIKTNGKVPLSEADDRWAEWVAWVDRQSGEFSSQIDKGRETAAVITALTNTGIQFGTEASSSLPGGALIGSGLALLGGLFIRKPGDKKAIKRAEAKEAVFAGGLNAVLDAVRANDEARAAKDAEGGEGQSEGV